MPAIVEFPKVVREAVSEFSDLFSCEPQRRHFAEYLTGLMVAANKTVTGNRTTWEVCRIVRTYRDRWTGTETYHLDGKQLLGMGDCQLRDGQGQTRHMYLVMLAYSLLMRQLRQDCSREWAFCRLKTIGEACRAMLDETLRVTLSWVVQQVRKYGKDDNHVFAKLRLA